MYGDHWRGRSIPESDLVNFRRNGMSAGLDGLTRRDQPIDEKCAFPGRAKLELIQLLNTAGIEFAKELIDVGVGNPYYAKAAGIKVTQSDIEACFNAWRVSQFCEPKHIVEIGAGFGALAVMLRKLYPSARITIVDLPEHKTFQEYYIEKVVGMEGIEITTELPDDADTVIALRCFMEMPRAEVDRYFTWLQGLTSIKHLYLINRYIKRNVLKMYPFDNNWRILLSQTFWPSAEIHELMLGRTEHSSDVVHKALQALPPFVNDRKIYDYDFSPKINVLDR